MLPTVTWCTAFETYACLCSKEDAWRILTCYVAYECLWKHPSNKTYKCHIAEDLVKAHYPSKVQEYNKMYGI